MTLFRDIQNKIYYCSETGPEESNKTCHINQAPSI